MSLTLIFFLGSVGVFSILSIFRHPFYGILLYLVQYFVNPKIFWWGAPVSNVKWTILTAALVVFSCLIHYKKIARKNNKTIFWMWAFLGLSITISATIAVHNGVSWKFTYHFFTFVVTWYMVAWVITTEKQYRYFILLLILCSFYLGYASLGKRRIRGRLESIGPTDSIGSNQFAQIMVAVVPLTIPFLVYGNKMEKIICILSLPFIFNAIILCNSRGAMVAFAGGLLLGFLRAPPRLRKRIILIVIVALPLFFKLMDTNFRERISSLWSHSEEEDVSTGRLYIWQCGLELALDHKLGTGGGGFKILSKGYMPEMNRNRGAHNTYLLVLSEQGIIGLCVYLLICFYAWKDLRMAIAQQPKEQSFFTLCVTALQISLFCTFINNFFTSRLYYEFFYMQSALAFVVKNLSTPKASENEEDNDKQQRT